MAEQPAPGDEDNDLRQSQAGNSDNFDGFKEPQVNALELTRSNNVAPRRKDINADLSERHIIQGPRTRQARANFTGATFNRCKTMALIHPTTKLADLLPEHCNYKQFLNHPRGNDLQPLQLYTDNQSALNMVRKDGHHERTKHIDNYYRYTKQEYSH
jgi:hypothetical protein